MALQMRWLGTACFEIRLPNDRTLVIDPYMDDSVSAPIASSGIEGCDYIFLTHGHYDHVLDVGKLARRFMPRIFCSQVAADSLTGIQGVDPGLISVVTAGDTIREEGLTVEVLQGQHVEFAKEYERLTGRDVATGAGIRMDIVKDALKVMLGTDLVPDRFEEWMTQYPQGEQLNYVFDPPGGRRIYMAGSYPAPNVIREAKRANAYVTLLQVLPGNTVRGMEVRIAELAFASGCRIAVPQHHDPLFEGSVPTDLSELKRILSEDARILFKELIPGQWYGLDALEGDRQT